MNKFGGIWTEIKIEAFLKYADAYLQIMKTRKFYRLHYFDGFAGSGTISPDEETDQFIKGVAAQILSITEPRKFDEYTFIEKDANHAYSLKALIEAEFPDRNANVLVGDCNDKLLELAGHMRHPDNKNDRTLAFLDPYGMQLGWETLDALRGLDMDVWILVPTGIGITRLLKNDGDIPPAWMARLVTFFGMPEDEIKRHFYRQEIQFDMFSGEETVLMKHNNAAERAARLYRSRITAANIFRFVSDALVMCNSKKSVLYHFILCSNNAKAMKIANDINKKINRR
jgi:three-Cys-motif partner protein